MLVHSETINGFDIAFYALPEDSSPEGMFSSGDDQADKDLIQKIYNGTYTWFIAKVTASKEGIELGTDYLGGCCYTSEQEFCTTYRNDYYMDMVNTAISKANTNIRKLCGVIR